MCFGVLVVAYFAEIKREVGKGYHLATDLIPVVVVVFTEV